MPKYYPLGVIGPNAVNCPPALYNFGLQLGIQLGQTVPAIVCGGMGGFMEAVCRGVKADAKSECLTIGILPGNEAESGNPWLDLAIPTGLGLARNVLVVNSSHLIVAAGGGPGTLSELAFALQTGKKVICVKGFGGFSEWMADDFGSAHPNQLIAAGNVDEIVAMVKELLPLPAEQRTSGRLNKL